MLDQKYIDLLKKQDKDIKKVEEQIQYFVEGFPYMKVDRPATVGDGIKQLSDKEIKKAINYYDDSRKDIKVLKFVPASGAASRMFKVLFSFMEQYNNTDEEYEKLKEDPDWEPVNLFFKHIQDFAFYNELKQVMEEDDLHLEERLLKRDYKTVLEYLLTDKGLNYGELPKGLLQFHKYEEGTRTPVEEHLVEAARYASCLEGQAYLHFTVSPEHEMGFKKHIKEVLPSYQKKFEVKYDLSFSQQKPSTDTIAVDMENKPFIKDDGEILFRPGGHGALIENLNDVDADLVFIKNIDNVVPDHLKDPTVKYKKVLAGVLMQYQEKIFYYLSVLNEVKTLSPTFIEEVAEFIKKDLCVELAQGHGQVDAREYFTRKLDRPIRVCGMVKNEGEPGGGPFWARNRDDTISLQIVESAQIDMEDEKQEEIAMNATHFNPVDLVCGVKDRKGNHYDLPDYVDPQTGFISKKSMGGRELKALELPGLWNGSMSDWITIFVEVPIETFNPVKVANDLLRDQHQ